MNKQSRKYQLTINNPAEHNFDHTAIKGILSELKLIYYCLADEMGLESKTPHTHVFLIAKSPLRFSRLKQLFPTAHIETAHGSAQENVDYIKKEGKWKEDTKADTSIPNTFEEWGEIPPAMGQGYRSDIAWLYEQIDTGKSNAEIMRENPDISKYIDKMDKIRIEILEEKYRNTFRQLEVIYIWGETETGKTRSVMEKHGYCNVYRLTDYKHMFDRYHSEPVLLLDEFRSSIYIGDILTFLEGYPLNLPARYANRVACYETVYIISNIDLSEQYPNIQMNEPNTWQAFLRRINKVRVFSKDGSIKEYDDVHAYLRRSVEPHFIKLPDDTPTPFDQITQEKLEI